MSTPPYGYCPLCGCEGESRELRPDGNDTCQAGHVYPSASAVKSKAPAGEPIHDPGITGRKRDVVRPEMTPEQMEGAAIERKTWMMRFRLEAEHCRKLAEENKTDESDHLADADVLDWCIEMMGRHDAPPVLIGVDEASKPAIQCITAGMPPSGLSSDRAHPSPEGAAEFGWQLAESLRETAETLLQAAGLMHAAKHADDGVDAAPEVRAMKVRGERLDNTDQRIIFDAIRSAYRVGYNDAMYGGATPGTVAHCYKGEAIVRDRGGELIRDLNRRQ